MDRSVLLRAAAVASSFALVACSRDAGVRSSHVGARVNGGEISVRQVHGALTQAASALESKSSAAHALEELIDEALLVQRASDYVIHPAHVARPRVHSLEQLVVADPGAAWPFAPGAIVLQRVQAEDAPLSERQATPIIEQFLGGRRRPDAAREEVRKLREQANIEYVGDFGSGRGERAADAVSPAAPLKKVKATVDGGSMDSRAPSPARKHERPT